MTQEATRVSAEEVEAALAEVLARAEFDAEPSLLAEFFEWLSRFFDTSPADATPMARELPWILGVLLALVAAFLATRLVAAGRRERRGGAETPGARGPSIALRVLALRREAHLARRAGDLRLALRKSFFALVLGLGGRGDLEFRDAWTNREILRRGHPAREVHALLSPLVHQLEAKEFGRERVEAADLDRLEELCVRYLGPLPTERAA